MLDKSSGDLLLSLLSFSMGTVKTVNTLKSLMISSPFATFWPFWQHKVRVQSVDSLSAEESFGSLAERRDI